MACAQGTARTVSPSATGAVATRPRPSGVSVGQGRLSIPVIARNAPVYPFTLAASCSLAWPLGPRMFGLKCTRACIQLETVLMEGPAASASLTAAGGKRAANRRAASASAMPFCTARPRVAVRPVLPMPCWPRRDSARRIHGVVVRREERRHAATPTPQRAPETRRPCALISV